MTDFEKQKVRQFNQNLYTIGFCILAFKSYVMDSSILINLPNWFDLILTGGFILFMCWKLATQTYSVTKIIFFSILGCMCLYTCPKVDNYYLIFGFFGIAAAQNVNLKEVLKYTSMVKTSIIFLHVTIYFVNLAINPSSITYSFREDGIPRHFFYLGHANTFAGYVLWTSLEYIYANYERIKKWQLGVILGINWFFYFFADSNTSVATATVIIGLLLLDKCKVTLLNHVLKYLAKYMFMFFSIIFSMACVFYVNLSGGLRELFDMANVFFTGRLLFGAYVYDANGFSFLGRAIAFPKKIQWREFWFDAMVFDNAYIWMFVLGGAIYLVLISIGIMLITRKTSNVENIMLIAYSIYGVSEAYVMNAGNCFPLLLIGIYLYKRSDGIKGNIKEKKFFRGRKKEEGMTAYERVKYHNSSL